MSVLLKRRKDVKVPSSFGDQLPPEITELGFEDRFPGIQRSEIKRDISIVQFIGDEILEISHGDITLPLPGVNITHRDSDRIGDVEIIAYKTKSGNIAILNDDSEPFIGFKYINKLLGFNNHTHDNHVFSANSVENSISKALDSGRKVYGFFNVESFLMFIKYMEI